MRVRFGPFELDAATRELLHAGRRVHLSPKSFDLLQIAVEQRPALVTKAELQDRLWPDCFVLEANLGNAVAKIRKALGDDSRSPRFIATVSRRGYRFSADAVIIRAQDAVRPHAPLRWLLEWKEMTLPLSQRANIFGPRPNRAHGTDAS